MISLLERNFKYILENTYLNISYIRNVMILLMYGLSGCDNIVYVWDIVIKLTTPVEFGIL